jgi:hypothetical protein
MVNKTSGKVYCIHRKVYLWPYTNCAFLKINRAENRTCPATSFTPIGFDWKNINLCIMHFENLQMLWFFEACDRCVGIGRCPWRRNEICLRLSVTSGLCFFFLVSWGGVRLSPLGTSATICPIVPAPDDRWWWMRSRRWNENLQGKPKYSEKTCPQCHFVQQKSHMNCPGLEPGPPR